MAIPRGYPARRAAARRVGVDSPGGGGVFARSSGHATSPRIHYLLQRGKGFHCVGVGGGDLGEQRCANGDFQAVLQVDRDQVHGSGLDGWAETAWLVDIRPSL
jgi:hypothetical protein